MTIKRHICTLPDGGSLDLDLHQYEVYVFVDDDKGPNFGRPDNVIGILARSFERLDCDFFVRLTRSLAQRRAWEWHSSANKGLHHDPNMRAILKTLGKCKSRVFSFRRIERQLDGDEILGSILHNIESEVARFSNFWPTDNRQARLLLWAIKSTFRSLMRGPWDIPKPKAVTFFVDRMSFFPANALSIAPVSGKPGMFFALDSTTPLGIDIRVVSFVDRLNLPIWIKMYLGLVDGEAWLHGRFLREAPTGGSSIDRQGLIFSGLSASEADDFLFDVSCVESAIQEMKHRGGNFERLSPQLELYSRHWRKWLQANQWVYNDVYWGDQLDTFPKPKLVSWLLKG
jgi:hypothetical protein